MIKVYRLGDILENLAVAVLLALTLFLLYPAGMDNSTVNAAMDVKVPILLYHHINEIYTPDIAHANLTPDEFRLHMLTLKAYRYNPISLKQYYDYVTYKIEKLPSNPIVITFDDGYESNYTQAFPILKELGIPATIFVVTDTVGKQAGDAVNYAHFSWEQAREMMGSGLIDSQAHTATHKSLRDLPVSEIQKQMRGSKYQIEKNLDKACYALAYPYGGYTDQIVNLGLKAGYKMQILVGDNDDDIKSINLRSEGTNAIKRLTVRGHMSNMELIEMLNEAES